MLKVQFVVFRNCPEEKTVAIVQANVSDEMYEEKSFFNALKKALTTWRVRTDRGGQAWIRSSEDFNVGDLCEYQDDEYLKCFLREVGIRDLTVRTESSDSQSGLWSFDTVLMEE